MSLVLVVGTACMPVQPDDSVLQAKDDHKQTVNADCFTVLLPGSIVNGRLSNISFANGACQGDSRALNKMSSHSKISVYRDGERFESNLYVDGLKVLADLGGQKVQVATMSSDLNVSELALVNGTELSLVIKGKDGISRKWTKGDDSNESQEEIRLNIR